MEIPSLQALILGIPMFLNKPHGTEEDCWSPVAVGAFVNQDKNICL